MSEMQWRKANGETGTYTGPLIHLGSGIPRRMGDHGVRRALYDLAFGYVSGFPIRDIIPFAIRSLWPSPVQSIEVVDDPGVTVGTAYVECPVCNDLMPATVTAEIREDSESEEMRLACTPDMTDIHAHMWSHENGRSER